MIAHMIRVIFVFIVIWGAWLICCSQIMTLLFFQENENFSDLLTSFRTLINASFNNFDLTLFSERSGAVGRPLFIINIVISSLFLMNMIVAVLTNIYKKIMLKIDADYNANLVMAEAKMRWDSMYGMFIIVPHPINFISFMLLPVQLIIGKKCSPQRVKRFNSIFSRISYFPIALGLYLIFLLGSIILAPLAYLKGLFLLSRSTPFFLLTWLFLGPLLLLMTIAADSIKYFRLLYFKHQSFKKKQIFLDRIYTSERQLSYREELSSLEASDQRLREFRNMD